MEEAVDALAREGTAVGAGEEQWGGVLPAPVLLEHRAHSGRGISEAERERIFLPFVSTKSDGLGLGLAIVRRRTPSSKSRAGRPAGCWTRPAGSDMLPFRAEPRARNLICRLLATGSEERNLESCLQRSAYREEPAEPPSG
jgi:hypothetical protein